MNYTATEKRSNGDYFVKNLPKRISNSERGQKKGGLLRTGLRMEKGI